MSTVATTVKKWKLDTYHTSIGFKIGHLGLAYIRGVFNEYEGTVSLEGDGFENSKISLTIYADSINTGNDMRDNHLKTPEFIDAFSFPEITFESSAVMKTSNDTFDVVGDLTIKGITKTITLKAKHPGLTIDMYGNSVAIFHLTGLINRFDFGIEWNTILENGLMAVSKEIEFDMNIELVPEEA